MKHDVALTEQVKIGKRKGNYQLNVDEIFCVINVLLELKKRAENQTLDLQPYQ